MIRLDRPGLEYLIEVANDIGFSVIGLSSEEFESQRPEIHLSLRQMRDQVPTPEPNPVAPEPTEPEPIPPAAEPVMPKGQDVFTTLDDGNNNETAG